MAHLRPLSNSLPRSAQTGRIDFAEQLILTLLGLYFSDWQNYPIVSQNLRKYYAKTP